MTSAERLCMVAARSEALLADFVLLFLVRWGLKYIGVDYYYCQPFLDQVSPPLGLSDLQYPGPALFWSITYFVSGLPEVVFAAMWALYALLSISIFGRTLGMRQAGIVLVDNQGHKPHVLRVLVRQMVAPFSSILLIGYWPLAWNSNATTIHDIISGTHTVYAEKKPRN